MGRVSISEDYDRLERRWRRMELKLGGSSIHYHHVGATRTASKNCGNKGVFPGKNKNANMKEYEADEDYKKGVIAGKNKTADMEEDEVDEDYKKYLDMYFSNNDDVSDNDDTDPDYMTFLTKYAEEGNYDVDPFLETERGPRKSKRRHQDVSSVSEPNCCSDLEDDDVDEDYQSYLDSLDDMDIESLGTDQEFDTPEVSSEIDEDYEQFLTSGRILDGDWVDIPGRNATKINNKNDDSSSSESDLILLEPDQICGNTPFISSKGYDLSFLENETDPVETMQLHAHDHSQFRRRLMEYLKSPYDQEEYDSFMSEVCIRRRKEKHAETRRGVIKKYHTHGVNKSYLEMYPALADAIDKFNEPPKALFLLRGFVFWLKNTTYSGIFQPWCDDLCLEILRKM